MELCLLFSFGQTHLPFAIRVFVLNCIAYFLWALYLFAENSSEKMVQKFIYPEARRDISVVENHFGTEVCIEFPTNRQAKTELDLNRKW